MGYIILAEALRQTCMNSSGTAVNAGRKCGIRVSRWVNDGETEVPETSKYLFEHLLATVDANEYRYQHKWTASVTLDSTPLQTAATFYFPQKSLLNASGYLHMKKGTYYVTYSYTVELKNDGTEHTAVINASCASTTPKNCRASVAFTTPSSLTAPEISNLVVSQDTLGRINNVICNCGGNSAPSWFECIVTHYNNNGNAVASQTYTIAADITNPWHIEISATQLPLLADVVAGNAVHIKLKALNYAGSSEDTEFVVYPGAGACKLAGGDFKNATPYVYYNGEWVPAITYGNHEDSWPLTRQGVEVDYVLPK